jgi:sirohydrochlorin cobaltochelatase
MMTEKKDAASLVIVLAMHGAPPLDFPKDELAEFFSLHARLGHAGGAPENLRRRYAELEARMRGWPRTTDNDPFHAGSMELAEHLRRESGLVVIVGFNEFCSPSLTESLAQAAGAAQKILVITPMMTRGGEHSAVDIPEAIRAAQQKHPGKEFVYVWPFPTRDIARFLSVQISRYL